MNNRYRVIREYLNPRDARVPNTRARLYKNAWQRFSFFLDRSQNVD